MPFKVPITPRIEAKLRSILGQNADLSKLAVYEARSNDTRMLARTGGIMKNSRMDKSYLEGMAKTAQMGAYVPLASHHNTFDHAEGRIFDAAVYEAADGNHELHTLFYVPADTNPNSLDSKLSQGIINSVSTNTVPSSIKCSACGFNFMQDDKSTSMLFSGRNGMTPICANKHESGKDGNHLVLSGTPKIWREQSLVMNGAVAGASILSAENQKLAHESTQIGLAASDVDDKLAIITTAVEDLSPPPSPTPKGKTKMADISVPLADYEAGVIAKGKVSDLEAKLTAAETAKTTAETAKTEAEAKLATAEGQVTALTSKVTELEAKLAAAGVAGDPKTTPTGSPTATAKTVDSRQFKRAE